MAMAATAASRKAEATRAMTGEEIKVIIASSAGTIFEWYDFYLAGSLAANISAAFFSGVNPTAAFIFTLLSFAAGFAVRPFGALFFGRLGDMIGRKYTFLVTMTLMGLATFVVGFLPSYASIGIAAPVLFITCRLVQGLALGGEYGGAATYVAEHAPQGRRGFYTSWICGPRGTTPTLPRSSPNRVAAPSPPTPACRFPGSPIACWTRWPKLTPAASLTSWSGMWATAISTSAI